MIRLLAFLILLGSASAACADGFAELQILKGYFGSDGIKNKSQVYGGEMAERYLDRPSWGEILPEENAATFRLLEEGEGNAVYLATVETEECTREWSAFFSRSPLGSRLVAVKALKIPPYLYEREFNSLAAKGGGRNSLEELRYLRLSRLFASSDELKKYLNDQLQLFDKIATLVETGKVDDARAAGVPLNLSTVKVYGESKSEGELALLASTSSKDFKLKVGTEIRLAEFFDSAVGLLHLPPGVLPPPMSARDYIQVEPTGIAGWYLFRNIAAIPAETATAKGKKGKK